MQISRSAAANVAGFLPTRARAGASVLAALCVCLSACSPGRAAVTIQGATMGTTYHVVIAGAEAAEESQLRRSIERVLAEVDAHLSTYSPTSEISRFNASHSTGWIAVSEPLQTVVDTAQRISRQTEGAFDITVGPLVSLWGFGPGNEAAVQAAAALQPDPQALREARSVAGYGKLEVRDGEMRKHVPGLALDVNAIAPGYAVDRIAETLERAGFHDYLVEIGGEVRASGHRPDGKSWQIAIEEPLTGERRAYAGLQLSNLAVSTSGNYRDFRRLADGREISHTIDPRTGEPVTHPLVSVTVVNPRTMDADAYATALLVLGTQDGFALAERLGLPALFIERTTTAGVWRERATPQLEQLRRPVE